MVGFRLGTCHCCWLRFLGESLLFHSYLWFLSFGSFLGFASPLLVLVLQARFPFISLYLKWGFLLFLFSSLETLMMPVTVLLFFFHGFIDLVINSKGSSGFVGVTRRVASGVCHLYSA